MICDRRVPLNEGEQDTVRIVMCVSEALDLLKELRSLGYEPSPSLRAGSLSQLLSALRVAERSR